MFQQFFLQLEEEEEKKQRKKREKERHSLMVVDREDAAWSDDLFVLSALSLNWENVSNIKTVTDKSLAKSLKKPKPLSSILLFFPPTSHSPISLSSFHFHSDYCCGLTPSSGTYKEGATPQIAFCSPKGGRKRKGKKFRKKKLLSLHDKRKHRFLWIKMN